MVLRLDHLVLCCGWCQLLNMMERLTYLVNLPKAAGPLDWGDLARAQEFRRG
jgi:hypothetical protein